MRCLRCGKETDSTFCKECLADMEQHPVKPGTPVIVSPQPKAVPRQTTRARRPEEEVKLLRRRIRNLHIALLCTLAVAVLFFTLWMFSGGKRAQGVIGQNYSTTESTGPVLPGSVAG